MSKSAEKVIYVYEEFFSSSSLMGELFVSSLRGEDVFSFDYDPVYLASHKGIVADPDLFPFEGRQYLPEGKKQFGIFVDSEPDRWGKTLLKRKETLLAKKEGRPIKTLREADFLLGVEDETRMGALRFKESKEGPFLSSSASPVPPLVKLRELEQASYGFEQEEEEEKWLGLLLSPGSSLGGARPKANVKDPSGNLWIAKFPSRNDEFDVGAWEYVAHELARICGISVPEAKLLKLSPRGSTYLSKRFDRESGKRVHFASAMTLLGKKDFESEETSHLDLLEFLLEKGSRPKEDALELFRRLLFSLLIKNSDNHLRNHGFLLRKDGWVLSPLYDANPNPEASHLCLGIEEGNSSFDLDAAIKTSHYYGLSAEEANDLASKMMDVIRKNYVRLAKKAGIAESSISDIGRAFSRE